MNHHSSNLHPVNRVPPIVLSYWIIKIASTTLGETGADMFSQTLDLGYAATGLVFLALFAVSFGIKLRIGEYRPVSYWFVFTISAILGTLVSDFLDRTLGLGYTHGSAILVALLVVTLGIWRTVEGSLSVENIKATRPECFYWLAFFFANTLGTAAGDCLSDDFGLGFITSAAIIALLLGLTAVAHYRTQISKVFLFWFAFVLTRPFGATFGDLLTKPTSHGGLALGTYGASSFFLLMLAVGLWREHRALARAAVVAR